MDDIHEKLYKEIAALEKSEPAPLTQARHLQRIALRRTQSQDMDERLGALRVSIALPTAHGMPMIRELLLDPESNIRQLAYAHAVALEQEGLPLLRRVVEGKDLEIASDALNRLVQVQDRGSVALMRRLLDSPAANLRAGAATLLGQCAGPSLVPKLQRLAASDPDEEVRDAATLALQQIMGDAPDVDEADDPTAQKTAEESGGAVQDLPSPDAKTGLLPLPSPMPEDVDLLLQLLGGCAPADRDPVLQKLENLLEEVGERMSLFSPDHSPWLGAGLGLAASHFARPAWAQSLRRLLQDTRPGVRSEAARALGAVGGLSQIPQMQGLLEDDDALVRLATVEGLGALCARFDRLDLVRARVSCLVEDPDPTVRDAVSAILDS